LTRNIPEKLYLEFFSKKPNEYVFPDRPNKNLIEFTENFKQADKEMIAVDLGCGEGRTSVFLAKEGFNVIGIDLSPTIIKKGIERFGRNKRVDYCVAEITYLPIRSETFHLAIDITTLNNQKSRKRSKYVKEIKRILKKKGYYYATVVSLKDPSCKEKCPKRHFILRKNGSYQQFYSIGILKKLFMRHLNLISIKERKDGVSEADEFESIEVIAEK